MIKVLVVDDSPTVQEMMKYILTSDKDIQVIGIVNNGVEALSFLERVKPDVITMDVNMPYMNGFEATERIMETNPVPIIMVTALVDSTDVEITFQAMQAGAVSIIEKPTSPRAAEFHKISKNIIDNVKIMSEVKVVKRKNRRGYITAKNPFLYSEITNNYSLGSKKIVVIGVSTGGPPILKSIFSKLNEKINLPILVVQHITPGFIGGLVEWLKQDTKLPIHIAQNGENVIPGHIYFAPDDYHMEITFNGKIHLSKEEKINGLRPTVSHLFNSAMNAYGKNTIGILLSGMGRDGAKELKLLKEKGALTVAQDKETSVVYGMPGEAAKIDAATYILSTEKIADLLNEL
jgi:two-component system chemotaxis response regulator CheB